MRPFRVTAAILLVAFLTSCAGVRKPERRIPPDYRDSPVYFEMFWQERGDSANLRLMPEGHILLTPLGVEDITGFDWKKHERTDLSWWIRMERMDYLLTLIESDDDAHQDLVYEWVNRWWLTHDPTYKPNQGCSDAMGIGIRGMVLVRYLKHIERDDPEMAERLKKSIKWTQDYLLDEKNFNLVSNHAMWESMGLFETTRVWPDTTVMRIALDRLHRTVKASVSTSGMHVEHSPSYHFYFLGWLDNYVAYLESLELPGFPGIADMAEINRRMKVATYFLYDHNLTIPQIGDTDGKKFAETPYAVPDTAKTAIWYDEQAGFAIYKDPPGAKAKRYVVFCNQNRQERMRYHFHNDRMAVYYNYDGETILGDGGRYSYTNSATRTYVRSSAAHNTVLREVNLSQQATGMEIVRDEWWRQLDDANRFGAKLVQGVVRTLTIPDDEPRIMVNDLVRKSEPWVVLWRLGPDVASYALTDSSVSDTLRTWVWSLVTPSGRVFKLVIDVRGPCEEPARELAVLEAAKNPYIAWYSPAYNTLVPTPTIQVRIAARGPVRISTRIALDERPDVITTDE